MRALGATAIGIVCAGAVLLPLVPTENAGSRPEGRYEADAVPPESSDDGSVPGSTQSLPLVPGGGQKERGASTRTGDRLMSAWEDDPAGGRRADSGKVEPFSLVGVVWDDPSEVPPGKLQVQTRASDGGGWSPWRTLGTGGDGASGGPGAKAPGGPEGPPTGHGEAALGATAPLWVGDSTAVRVRILSPGSSGSAGSSGSSGSSTPSSKEAGRAATGETKLPEGARLELVDPGESRGSVKRRGGVLPALTRSAARTAHLGKGGGRRDARKARRIAPRPRIVTRKGWGADESLREKQFAYGSTPKAAVIHHSAETNAYDCADTPAVIRSIYRFHVRSSHWRDIGYNFLVDKCGTVYEGRAGGVDKAVQGAHTLGFNDGTTGIALLGTYSRTAPPAPAVRALARLTAWKLGVHGVDARGNTTLTSQGSSKYARGKKVRLPAVFGHRDGVTTDCPGGKLYGRLPDVRDEAGRLQSGR